MLKAVKNCWNMYLLVAAIILAALFACAFAQPAHAVTQKISGNINASSLRSGVDYEVDAQCTITIGEDDEVTIDQLTVGSSKSLKIVGSNNGSLTVKNGIICNDGARFALEGGIVNVRQDNSSLRSCYGVAAKRATFAITGGMLNIKIDSNNANVTDVCGLYAKAIEMSGGSVNVDVSASPNPSPNLVVKGIGIPYDASLAVTGGVINANVHSKTTIAQGFSTDSNSPIDCSFANATIVANATTDSTQTDLVNKTCGIYLSNDDANNTNTFFNCTVLASGTGTGMLSDGKVVNSDSFFELHGQDYRALDMQYSELVLQGDTAALNVSTDSVGDNIGAAIIKAFDASGAEFTFEGGVDWNPASGKITYGDGRVATAAEGHSKIISHKLVINTNLDYDASKYNLDGYFVESNKTGDAVTKGPRTYAVGEEHDITLKASTNIPGHKFKGWYKSLSGQPVSTNAQYTYTMVGTADDTLIAVFESGKVPVSTLTFSGGKQPVGGQSIVAPSISVAQKGVSVTKTEWYDPTTGKPVSGTFQANKAYSLRISVSLGSHYEWASQVTASLDGQQIGNVSGNKNIWQATYVATDPSPTPPPEETLPMHRLYNPNSGEHFYTADDAERDYLVSLGWHNEGEGWTAPKTSNTPVYRLYNAIGGEHHYTMNADEKNWLVGLGWSDEGIGWYSDDAKRTVLYREYNPNAFANNHNYTTSWDEHAWLIGLGWRDEGTAWYGV